MTRLVVDTSTLLSGLVSAPTSPPALVLVAARAGRFDLIACPRVLVEVERGLAKPYFRARLDASAGAAAIDAFRRLAITLPDPPVVRSVLRDPNDDFLVALARAGEAEAIVSGDADLLDHDGLHPPAIHARAACELLGLL